MGNLYVVRHGETVCNAQSIIQGPRVDSELSTRGQEQARLLGGAFSQTPLDAVYVSPLLRARQTADSVSAEAQHNVASQVVPEFYEMDYGNLCGQAVPDVQHVIDDVLGSWQAGMFGAAFPGGESPALTQHRVRPFAKRLLEDAQEQDIAVFGHGRVNRILLATLLGEPLGSMARFPQSNACITHVEIDAQTTVRRVNDTSHLAAMG